VDPLACQYEYAVHHYAHRVPEEMSMQFSQSVATSARVPGSAETVVQSLVDHGIDKDNFSLIHSGNSVDHAQDPILALRQISKVTPFGQTAHVWVSRNAGVANNGRGLHQWNFDVENDNLVVRVHQQGVPLENQAFKNANDELKCDAVITASIGEKTSPTESDSPPTQAVILGITPLNGCNAEGELAF